MTSESRRSWEFRICIITGTVRSTNIRAASCVKAFYKQTSALGVEVARTFSEDGRPLFGTHGIDNVSHVVGNEASVVSALIVT